MSVVDCGVRGSADTAVQRCMHWDCRTETQQRSSRYVYFNETASSEFIGTFIRTWSHTNQPPAVWSVGTSPDTLLTCPAVCLETQSHTTATRAPTVSQSRLQLVITQVKSTDTARTELGAWKSENNNNNNTVSTVLSTDTTDAGHGGLSRTQSDF